MENQICTPKAWQNNRLLIFTTSFILVYLIGYLLNTGRSLLIPIVIAIFIWHLLNTINTAVKNIPFIGWRLNSIVSRLLSLLILLVFVTILVNIIGNNVSDVVATSPRYQDNLAKIISNMEEYFRIKTFIKTDLLLKDINLQQILINIYGVFTTITGSTLLIILYVVFLFVEQHFFKQKIKALFPQPEHLQLVNNIINHIVQDTQTYLGLKTFFSIIAATTSWIIMKIVGLDFAEFWALLIFFLNFIPSIGPIIATVLPALLALIQFVSWFEFFIIIIGITTIQFIIGNILEPRFFGKSLNLSPLVILFSLAFWGAIWGIIGMFLSVPITVMLMIVLAHFDATRPIAVLLSQDGHIHKSYEKLS